MLGKRARAADAAAVVPALERALASSSAPVRANAAAALYRLNQAPAALVRLLEDRDPAVRANAALAAARRADARATVEHLRAADDDPHVRATAARALAPALPSGGRAAWVAVHLVDFDGAPLADARYLLCLADGLCKAGVSDARGTAREESAPAGTWSLRFP